MKKKVLSLNFIWKIRLQLRAEGNKLQAEGNKLWAEGVLEVYGNIKLEWIWQSTKQDYDCKLETGEIFKI